MSIIKYNFYMDEIIRKFVAWFLNLLYGPFAFAYNIVAFLVSMGNWHKWTYQIIDYLEENDTILEVGIGTGNLSRQLKTSGFSVIGSERSKQMIKINKTKSKDKNMNIVRADNRYLPFMNHGYSKIIATFPSNYIFDKSFYDEAMRCLSKNGEMIILLSVIFSNKKITNRFYNILYKMTGMTTSKEKIEHSIFSTIKHKENLKIEWKNYKNVELCFVRIKNC